MSNHPTKRASAWHKLTRRKEDEADLAYSMEAEAAKALAHPKRMLLLDLLSDGDERTVTELVDMSGIPQSNVSQNLAIMRASGLVAARRDGNQVHYRVRDPRVLKALDLLRAVAHDAAADEKVLAARAAAERAEKAKRTRTIGAFVVVGLAGVTVTLAALCPFFVGGSMGDLGPHVHAMIASTSFSGLLDVCLETSTRMVQAAGMGASDTCVLC